MRRVDSLEKTLLLGGLGAGGEGDDRGWDDWMASLTRWTWVWVNSWSWWWTGRPGMQRFMGLQRVGYDWLTELNWYLCLYFWKRTAWAKDISLRTVKMPDFLKHLCVCKKNKEYLWTFLPRSLPSASSGLSLLKGSSKVYTFQNEAQNSCSIFCNINFKNKLKQESEKPSRRESKKERIKEVWLFPLEIYL